MRGELGQRIERLPTGPGVYVYRDAAGRAIYIGKAKSLRDRVRSYFREGARHDARIARMVSEVADLEVIAVGSEMEALILESNLVQRERPRFNVVLRDDKNFPYLRLSTTDRYPRVSLVRSARVDGDVYVGPFLPASSARRTMKLVQRYFQVATCNEPFDGKRRPCLYYHLDQCLAPCAGKTNPVEYRAAVDDARLFLEGRDRDLERSLETRMGDASAAQEYERAARLRDTLRTVRSLAVRQRMRTLGLEDQDYLAHHADGAQAVLELFQVRGGRVSGRREFSFEELDVEPRSFYGSVLVQYYGEVEPPPEIYLPVEPEDKGLLTRWLRARRGARVELRVPRRGSRRALLDLVAHNAKLAFAERFRAAHRHGVDALAGLARALGLDEPPRRIECFDVSNLHGTDSVASLVVWDGGRPRRSEYRTFHPRVEGPDDYASIADAVTRRYRRLVAENGRLPDLVIIDGGRGQLGAAIGALAREGLPTLAVVALAKRDEELYLPGVAEPLRLDRGSPALQLVQRIRDEAHRFAITRHRRRRSRRTLASELTEIRGIGPRTATKLLRAFGSVRGVRGAAPADWERVAGPRAARALEARYRSS
jgi:excinuclease ABC subunit C